MTTFISGPGRLLANKRYLYAIASLVVVAAGLASRRYPWILPTILGKYPGDALWAVMVFCVWGFWVPEWSTARLARCALITAYADEFTQIYQSPWINDIRKTTIGHLLLGSTFSWLDMLAYTVGLAVVAACRETLRRRRS